MKRWEFNEQIQTIAEDAVNVAAGMRCRQFPIEAAGIANHTSHIAATVIRKIREQYHIRRKVTK